MPKRVRMLRDETVAFGPQRLHGGEVYDLPDGLAQYLVRTGVAVRADEPASSEIRRWEGLTVGELRDVARERDIPGRSSMTKAELIAALEASDEDNGDAA